jgi:hypothetical protein
MSYESRENPPGRQFLVRFVPLLLQMVSLRKESFDIGVTRNFRQSFPTDQPHG